MNAKALLIVIIFGIATPAWAEAPTIDQLVANPTLLNAEMDRCKHLGMAANDDTRCQYSMAGGEQAVLREWQNDLHANTRKHLSEHAP